MNSCLEKRIEALNLTNLTCYFSFSQYLKDSAHIDRMKSRPNMRPTPNDQGYRCQLILDNLITGEQ